MAPKRKAPVDYQQPPNQTRRRLTAPAPPAQISLSERRRALLFTTAAAGLMPIERFLLNCTYDAESWPTLSSLNFLGKPNWQAYGALKQNLTTYLSRILGNKWHSLNLCRVGLQMHDRQGNVITEATIDVVITVEPGLFTAAMYDLSLFPLSEPIPGYHYTVYPTTPPSASRRARTRGIPCCDRMS
ncbi:MAG: hypothetical protein Q9202_007339 [Teloschistes flavicans]